MPISIKLSGPGIHSAAAAAKSLQSCLTLCDPTDSSPPGAPVPGILQARTLEWVAISFPNAWKWKVKVKLLSRVQLFVTPWTAAYQAPPSMGFSRQEYWEWGAIAFSILTDDCDTIPLMEETGFWWFTVKSKTTKRLMLVKVPWFLSYHEKMQGHSEIQQPSWREPRKWRSPGYGPCLKGVYQLVGRKGLYEEEEQGSLSGKERMHILERVIFWETFWSVSNPWGLSMNHPSLAWLIYMKDLRKWCPVVYNYIL